MEIFAAVALIILGAFCVIKGADFLTQGSVALAERFHVPQIVIGLTIVAIGTSLPEFCVSLMSALTGTTGMAVGNVIGSNIFNTLMIVGLAAWIVPITVNRNTVRRDMVFSLLISVLLLLLAINGTINRLEAFVLLFLGISFITYTLKQSKAEDAPESEKQPQSWGKIFTWLALGLLLLPGGSSLFVEHAKELAHILGMSDAVVGLTIVAGGTSLPELATTIVAARKGNPEIAIGNVLGSNVMNILIILGLTGVISPMQIGGITLLDYSVLITSMLLFLIFSWTKFKIERWEGIILTSAYITYVGYLISQLA